MSRVDPDTGRIRASRNQTVLGALPKDLQTILKELACPFRAFIALTESPPKGLYFTYMYCVLSCFRCNLVSGYESYRMSLDAPGAEAITEHKTVLWACKRPLQGKYRLKTFPIRHENPPSGKHRTQHH